ncbi:hypothetical protein G163CM_06390 [Pseudocitrobacter corydidari]|uniref:Uncharacterized protein n=1 Tax=Pseudocitrobacter corydidari TaxID=2891570 RepID=A0ABY3S093_9ENTR|nr:hypothetical protein G163CM_06390 [Pseudocitrobacter corydidari]
MKYLILLLSAISLFLSIESFYFSFFIVRSFYLVQAGSELHFITKTVIRFCMGCAFFYISYRLFRKYKKA